MMRIKSLPTLQRAAYLVGALVVGLVAYAAVVVVGMRTKAPRALRVVRRVNRAVFNPMQMRSAGQVGAFASIIRHRGRMSGRLHETPVGAEATDDGFVIALPYGTSTDWLKNLLASGTATIVNEGQTYEVDQPEVRPLASELSWSRPLTSGASTGSGCSSAFGSGVSIASPRLRLTSAAGYPSDAKRTEGGCSLPWVSALRGRPTAADQRGAPFAPGCGRLV